MEDLNTYQESYTIRSSEVSTNGKAKLQSICDLLQETAGNHALKLNFDISQLKDKNLTWMLHRLHVRMDKFPEWRDEITVQTWPSSGDTLRAFRDFIILDSEGNKIGKCLSYWLMINIETRKPVRMPDEVLQMAPSDTEHVLEVKKNRIDFDQEVSGSKAFRVRRSDLDMNKHVNNVKYIEWALEALPSVTEISEMNIEFLAECTEGEEILSEIAKRKNKENGYCHRIIRKSDEKVSARAISLR
ncbi:MAG: acyl-[acyl-carrier-protein] thioesterase [Candidatus Halalkalibacterium sp. M3_1C_030]